MPYLNKTTQFNKKYKNIISDNFESSKGKKKSPILINWMENKNSKTIKYKRCGLSTWYRFMLERQISHPCPNFKGDQNLSIELTLKAYDRRIERTRTSKRLQTKNATVPSGNAVKITMTCEVSSGRLSRVAIACFSHFRWAPLASSVWGLSRPIPPAHYPEYPSTRPCFMRSREIRHKKHVPR